MLTTTTPAAARELTLLATVKDELGLTGNNTYDTLLTSLIQAASAAIEDHCQRVFAKQTYTETVAGFGSTSLLLSMVPVLAVTSITGPNGELVDATSYVIEDPEAGIIWRNSGWVWTAQEAQGISRLPVPGSEQRDYSVVYQAGYLLPDQVLPTLPANVERAAIQTVKAWFKRRNDDPSTGPATSVRFADGASVTYGGAGFGESGLTRDFLPGDALGMLSRYVRRGTGR